MNLKYLKILLFLFVTSYGIISAQDPFYLEYKFRLFNNKGQIITKDSLVQNTIFIVPNPGRILTTSYNDTTHYFYVKIRTTWPLFRIVWNHYNDIMEFSIDHRTSGKMIVLDTLTFSAGQYYISDENEKSWWEGGGLNIEIKEDEKSIHLLKFNYADFKTKDSIKNNKKLKKVKL